MHTPAHEQRDSRRYRNKITYVILWLMPQNWLAGGVFVVGTNEMEPMNLLPSVAPKSISPFWSFNEVIGASDTPRRLASMVPWEKKLSVTVGMISPPLVVPFVRSAGPTPRMPSRPCQRHISSTCWFVRYNEAPTAKAS